MKLTNISGATYYIKGGTNTGIYVFEDNSAMIIDAGISGLRTNKISRLLEENKLELQYIITTHEHDDHYGANYELKEIYPKAEILSSYYSKLYLENPELFSKYIMGGKSNHIMDSKFISRYKGPIIVDRVLEEGIVDINKIEFQIIELKGHTPGSIGILTKDKVLFLGDVLVGESLLARYDFLFLYDVEEQLKTLDKLQSIEFDYVILGHNKEILTKDESKELIEKHRQAIYKYINQILAYLETPKGVENLLKEIIQNNNLSHNYKEYHFFKSSLISLISYLLDNKLINYKLIDGELLYSNIQKK